MGMRHNPFVTVVGRSRSHYPFFFGRWLMGIQQFVSYDGWPVVVNVLIFAIVWSIGLSFYAIVGRRESNNPFLRSLAYRVKETISSLVDHNAPIIYIS